MCENPDAVRYKPTPPINQSWTAYQLSPVAQQLSLSTIMATALSSPCAREDYIPLQFDDDDDGHGDGFFKIGSPPPGFPATISNNSGTVKLEDDVYQRCGLERRFELEPITTCWSTFATTQIAAPTLTLGCVAVIVDLLAQTQTQPKQTQTRSHHVAKSRIEIGRVC